VLLVGFSLMTRSFLRLQANALGFDPVALIETMGEGGLSLPEAVRFWRTAIEEVRALPGVRMAAVTSRPPIRGARQRVIDVDGPVGAIGPDPAVGDVSISPGYFRTMGIPLLSGRAFDDGDHAGGAPVVIVSETLARRYFPGVDPVGRRLMIREREPLACCATAGPVAGVWRQVVGVAGDVRQGRLEEELTAMIYRPLTQIAEHDMFLMVRADSPAALPGIASALRSRLPRAPENVWTAPRLTRDAIDGSDSLRRRRFMLILLGAFAALAVALAGVGLYGVVAGSIAERRRELGVRVALGATPRAIARQVLSETLALWLVSLPIGAAAAYALSRFVGSLLYGVSPADAPTYVMVAVFLVGLTLAASYVPARRAARTDPLESLRKL
jgi:putative ABC transport system permease protein